MIRFIIEAFTSASQENSQTSTLYYVGLLMLIIAGILLALLIIFVVKYGGFHFRLNKANVAFLVSLLLSALSIFLIINPPLAEQLLGEQGVVVMFCIMCLSIVSTLALAEYIFDKSVRDRKRKEDVEWLFLVPCLECGHLNDKNNKYCISCGSLLKPNSTHA